MDEKVPVAVSLVHRHLIGATFCFASEVPMVCAFM